MRRESSVDEHAFAGRFPQQGQGIIFSDVSVPTPPRLSVALV